MSQPSRTMRLTKHHGLGNDFLVLLAEQEPADPPALAARLCDRRRGVGADGMLIGLTGRAGVDLTMVLHNADGSRAEMSGNGIRCLAQAEGRRRECERFELAVATDAGVRTVVVGPGPDADTVVATVDMGPAKTRPATDAPAATAMEVDLGNPHLVLLAEPGLAPLEQIGKGRPDRNVEIIELGAPDEVWMQVWERGVGRTEACGTGAAAAAVAAHQWELVGDEVTVQMPGGAAAVRLADEVWLTGPATYVATVEVEA